MTTPQSGCTNLPDPDIHDLECFSTLLECHHDGISIECSLNIFYEIGTDAAFLDKVMFQIEFFQ